MKCDATFNRKLLLALLDLEDAAVRLHHGTGSTQEVVTAVEFVQYARFVELGHDYTPGFEHLRWQLPGAPRPPREETPRDPDSRTA